MYSMVEFFTAEETIGQRKIRKDGSKQGNGLTKKTFDLPQNIKLYYSIDLPELFFSVLQHETIIMYKRNK